MKSLLARVPVGAIELVNKRTPTSKTFDLGNGRYRSMNALHSIHVPNDFAAAKRGDGFLWLDINCACRSKNAKQFEVPAAWYGLEIPKDAVGYDYTSKWSGSTVSVRLLEIDGKPVPKNPPDAVVRNGDIYWDNVVTDTSFYLVVRPGYIEMFKRIESAAGARSFLWEVTESETDAVPLNHVTYGHDNCDERHPDREALREEHGPGNPTSGPGRFKRHIEMLDPVLSARRSNGDGTVTFTVLERWSGKTILRDANRVPSLSDDVAYPVLIDVTVNEAIAANGDDGQQFGSNATTGTTWNTSYGSTGDWIIYDETSSTVYEVPGWRFTTVNVPQGATINSATLTLNLKANSSGSGAAATVYGNAHDNAPAWANGAGPINMTRTTASVSFGSWGGNQTNPTSRPLNVASIVQEIVNRAGWAANNALALGVANFTQNNNGSFHYGDDLAGGATGIATLDIDYTAAGGGGAMVGSATLTLGQSGTLRGDGGMVGAVSFGFSQTGTLRGAGALAGSSTVTFGQTGAGTATGAMTGSATLTFSQTGALAGAGQLVGTAAVTFGQTGALAGAGAMAGTATITFSQTGSFNQGAMTGAASMTLSGTATITSTGQLAGTASMSFAGTGALGGAGRLVGAVTTGFSQSGALAGAGGMQGTAAMTFSQSGTLRGSAGAVGTSPVTLAASGTMRGVGAMIANSQIQITASGFIINLTPVPDTFDFKYRRLESIGRLSLLEIPNDKLEIVSVSRLSIVEPPENP